MSRYVAGLAALIVVASGCDTSERLRQPRPKSQATHLVVTGAGDGVAGQVLPWVEVLVQDERGIPVVDETFEVTLVASGATLGGTTTRVASGGYVWFDDLVVTRAGPITLVATSPGLASGESAPFAVAPGPTASLEFEVQPAATTTAGATLPDVKVAARDAYGNRANAGYVELSLAGATLFGATGRFAESGVATFPALSVKRAGTGYVLSATCGSVGPVTSAAFAVLPATADRLVFAVEPATAVAGEILDPAIEVQVADAFGNLVPASLDVTVATTTLGGTTTVPAVAGVVTFADLRVTLAGIRTLVASADGLGSASASFVVQPAAAVSLGFVAQPPAAIAAGATIPTLVTVAAFDAYGNRTQDELSPVTVSVEGAELFGTTTQQLSSWGADFYGLSVRKAGTGYRLAATGRTALLSAVSSTFDVLPGSAHHLGFTAQPATAVAGATLAPVAVSALDTYGNPTVASGSVTIGFSAASSGFPTLYGTKTRPLVSGTATFDDLSVRVAGLGYRFAASGPVPPAASDTFDVPPGPPTQLAFLVQPVPIRSGQPMAPAVQVAITDDWRNVAPAEDRDVTLALEPNADGAVLAGTTTVATVARVAQYEGLTVVAPGSGYRIRASATGLPDAVSNLFDVTPNWVSIGPDGGDVTALAADPGLSAVAYAAAGGCVWKTTDGAATWTRACRGLGLQAFQIDALAVHPFRSQTVLAATSSGLYRSDDGGGAWTVVSSLGATTPHRTLAVAFAGSGAIYAGTYQNGLWRSDDDGATWARVGAGLPSNRITAIAVEPASSEVLYAAGVDPSEVGTVYRSSDRGDTWTETALGPAAVPFVKPTALLVDPTLADTLYVGTQSGVYESHDRGGSFTLELSGGVDVRDLAAYDGPAHVRYAAGASGLWRKVVGGGWTACTGLPTTPKVAAVAVRADGSALAGTRYGPYQGTNQGTTWTQRTTGLRAFYIGAIGAGAANVLAAATVYAATAGGGVYRSLNGGSTWTRGTHPAEGQLFYGIAVERASPSRAWLAGASGLYRTTDAGATWTEVLTAQGTMWSTILDPSNDAIVYAGGNNDVYRSTAGTPGSFRDLNVCGAARALALSSTAPLALWVGGDAGLCRVDLSRVNDVFVPYAFQLGTSGSTDAIAVDPDPALAGSTIWASTSHGFHTTVDGGASWIKTSGRFNSLLAQRGKLFGAPSFGGVSLSRDGGVTFAPVGTGLPASAIVRTLVDVALRPNEIYAGSITGSAYKTTSGGE